MSFDWLLSIGANFPDLLIFTMGIGFASYVMLRGKEKDRQIERLQTEVKDLRYSLSQTDKLAYGIGIAIQKQTGVKLLKQSANGAGDHALNRDV